MTYSSSIAYNRRRIAASGQNTASFSHSRGLGPISNTVILIVLACMLGLLYLTHVTKTNAFGYQINSLSVEQTQLKQENDDLTVNSARLQALDRVKNSRVVKRLVSAKPTETVQN